MIDRRYGKRTAEAARRCLCAIALAWCVGACTTKYGSTVSADRMVPPGSHVERLRTVSGVATAGRLLWAEPADGVLYERARREALADTGGNLLLDAQITTRLISYLGLYYLTSVTIEGAAAKIIDAPAAGISPK